MLAATIAILVFTVLEFPPPIGFETRPQSNVSPIWLVLFLAIVISEIATMILIFKQPSLGAKLAVAAGSLNILQIIAGQMHLMQPEVALLGYSLLSMRSGYSPWL